VHVKNPAGKGNFTSFDKGNFVIGTAVEEVFCPVESGIRKPGVTRQNGK
jgi:hypothetical protein